MEQPGALDVIQAQCLDAAAGFLFAQRERIVGAEHHLLDARHIQQIAQRLVVTPKTVSNHVEHIYSKIGVSSRAAATLYATRQGLLGTDETG